MKLEKVTLSNIRQFVGKQTIEFSIDARKKVTLIHGPNTVGKTTLLNAIYWCFYGEFLEGFNEPGRLRSDEVAPGEEYSVEVKFEHGGKHYIIERKTSGSPEDAVLTVLQQQNAGRSLPHPQPSLLIQQILPQQLAIFFFFAGEMIKKGFSTGANQVKTTEAIRAVLGFKLAEQAIEDLKEIRKKKQKELQAVSAGTDLARISSDLSEAEEFVDLRGKQLGDLRAATAQLEVQRREAFDRLRDMESSSKLQQRRDVNERQLKHVRELLGATLLARQNLINEIGGALFLLGSAKSASMLISEAVTKKRIPSPFDKTFVEDILKSEMCVCERPVKSGSNEYRAIASLINSATDESTINKALSVRGVAERVIDNASRAPKALQSILQQQISVQGQVEHYEQEEERIRDLLKRHEAQNVRETELQLERMEIVLRELIANKQRTEDEIEAKKSEIARLKLELERAQAASPQIEQVREGLELIEALVTKLEQELQTVEKRGIDRITEVLNDVVAKSTRQKYSATVTSEYVIRLHRGDEGTERRPVLVLSSGEQRLLDLCFISALVAVCREREEEKNAVLLPGAVAPLVVDAPFGELDPEYQALAAKTMMNLSDQLILLLSKTHWTPEVDATIRSFVGNEYIFIGHRKDPALGAESIEIKVGQTIYQQMRYESDKDCTEIQSIGRGK